MFESYLPIVPGKFNSSLFNIFYHLYLTFTLQSRDEIKGKLNDIVAKNYTNNYGIFGFSCRSLFKIFVTEYLENKTDRILVSPWIHSAFYKILKESTLKIYSLDYDENFNLIYPDDYKSCSYILISHNFGNKEKLKELYQLSKNHNIKIIEDMVQGGIIFDEKLDDNNLLSLYSGGQDKIPVSYGGGFGITDDSELYYIMNKKIESLPEDTLFNRFVHIFKKIPLYLLYQNQWLINLVILCYQIYQFVCRLFSYEIENPEILVSSIRKSYPGFKHNGYMLKPSVGQLNSMLYSLENLPYLDIFKTKINRLLFYEKNKQPWFTNFIRNVNYYSHIFSKDKNFIAKMSKKGYLCIQQQTWRSFSDVNNHLDNVYLLPNLGNFNLKQLKKLIKDLD